MTCRKRPQARPAAVRAFGLCVKPVQLPGAPKLKVNNLKRNSTEKLQGGGEGTQGHLVE